MFYFYTLKTSNEQKQKLENTDDQQTNLYSKTCEAVNTKKRLTKLMSIIEDNKHKHTQKITKLPSYKYKVKKKVLLYLLFYMNENVYFK